MLISTNNRLFFLPLLFFLFLLASGSPVLGRSFKRPDPLRHFKNYNGDFDVRNKHYLAVSRFSTPNHFSPSIFGPEKHIACMIININIIYMHIEIGFWSFSVCGIYRSPWIRICGGLVVMWVVFGHFHHGEVSKRWLHFISNTFGPLLHPHFLTPSHLHLACHVSIN